MEIHKPKPVHSLREFMAELGTIVLGIVIALTLEAAVEARRDAAMVAHARADFREELQQNRRKVAEDIGRGRRMQALFEQWIAVGQTRLSHQAAPPPATASVSRTFVALSESAWRTALSTQAMAHFPHQQARRIAEAYSQQETFAAVEQAAERDWFELAAYDPTGAGMSDSDIRQALKQVRVSYAYLVSLEAAETRLLAAYDAALAATT